MKIIPHRTLWLSLSTAMLIPSIIALLFFQFRLSADFTEGSLFAFRFTDDKKTVTQEEVRGAVESFEPSKGEEKITGIDLKRGSDGTYILRTKRIPTDESDALLLHIKTKLGSFELKEARSVSPLFAKSFRDNSLTAVGVASLMILLYITFAFRKVSRGIASWKLGVAAVIALLHDVFIILGLYMYLGHFFGAEIDALFITALLSVMGFSVHDTIVVFDRVRENLLHKDYKETFDEVAEKSVQQTIARSVNISLSAMLVLLPIIFMGAHEIFWFVLALTLGILVGTYSSIFVATPLLTIFQTKKAA